MKEPIEIQCVPLRNNIGIYKAANFIVGYFPCKIAADYTYQLFKDGIFVSLTVTSPQGEIGTVPLLPINQVTDPNYIYLSNIYGDLLGFFVNPTYVKQEKVPRLKLKSLTGLVLDSYADTNARNNWFVHIEQNVLRLMNKGFIADKIAEQCIYKLRLMHLSGMDYPKADLIDSAWCISFAKTTPGFKKKIGAIMRQFAWQACLKYPKENFSPELHYGVFPLPSTSRSIQPIQVEYLQTFLLPE